MEAVKEGRLIIVRVPLEGGGRLVVSVNDAEAKELYDVLGGVVRRRLITPHTPTAGLRTGRFAFPARAELPRCGAVSPAVWS